MHTRSRLNVRQVQSLKAPGVYSDGGGLYLRVRTGGSRSWLFIASIDGRRREIGLGSGIDISLAKARERAFTIRTAIVEGREPRYREPAERGVEIEKATTFGPFAEALIDDIEVGFRNEKHRKQWRATLKTHAAPILETALADVSTDDVVAILKPIWLSKPETASRVRGRIERVLDAAKAKGLRSGENPARWRGHLDVLLPRRAKTEQEHHAALPFDEIAAFIADLAERPAMAARALEFTILTAARSGETLGMRWSEVDLDAGVWSVPGDRMKAGAAHQVPLSSRAKALLLALLPNDNPKDEDFVFKGQSRGMLSNMAMAMLLRRMGRDEITVHGFRSTFRDWAGERTSFAREDIEMALAHTIESKAERAYRRGRALEKRRELMNAWADFSSTPRTELSRIAA